MKNSIAINEIIEEYDRATKKFSSFNSTHEGYAVILEELDELWDEIKANSDKSKMRKEAVQVAAMGLRFITDCCR
jgi:NTP pyrophosphatase (non-canonical NTP hydrolase)